ncbi:MAG: discoidin domain-containing protein [Planctomycetes bacterium]|nr:discoidin domain-containing protein [Planctomycetota bacterium]
MRLSKASLWVLAGLLALACGCNPNYGRQLLGSIPEKNTWVISGNMQDPQKAADGEEATAASGGNVLIIDLGKKGGLLNYIVLSHGSRERGFCRKMCVLTSFDGQNWSQCYKGIGTRKVSHAMLFTPIFTRYLRIQVIEAGDEPWTIAEVYLQ